MSDFHSKPYYDNWVRIASPEIRNFLNEEEMFLKKFLVRGCSVLDVGCGYGRTIQKIHNIPGKIVGIDNSKRMVKNAKLKTKRYSNVKIICMDAKKINLIREKFDFVLCLANTFGNFSSNKIRILKQIKKALSKNGKALIHVYNEKSLKYRLESYKQAKMPILKISKGRVYSVDNLVLEQFTKNNLKNLFTKAKLKIRIISLTPISYMCIGGT